MSDTVPIIPYQAYRVCELSFLPLTYQPCAVKAPGARAIAGAIHTKRCVASTNLSPVEHDSANYSTTSDHSKWVCLLGKGTRHYWFFSISTRFLCTCVQWVPEASRVTRSFQSIGTLNGD